MAIIKKSTKTNKAQTAVKNTKSAPTMLASAEKVVDSSGLTRRETVTELVANGTLSMRKEASGNTVAELRIMLDKSIKKANKKADAKANRASKKAEKVSAEKVNKNASTEVSTDSYRVVLIKALITKGIVSKRADVRGKKMAELQEMLGSDTKTKKTPATKTPAKKVVNLPKPLKDKMNKTQLLEHLVEQSGVDKNEVKAVLAALEDAMLASVQKKGSGEFMLPGMFKIVTKHIPKKKGGETKMSFGKEIVTKPKPATTRIKVRPMKKLKDAVLS